ncbi:helix-turn-helix domain-containing protein [Paenibacillus camerounensis]|uniref:helix-turn-helix domain-containing protein n=1 Tax=Paenibacillus camerounensis TaxID=1243663 RepID=UPI0005AADB96|nr:helix-turn-helix transcriptional regulator [Paenibacillus camerounensis]
MTDTFGGYLKQIREAKGLSINQLAGLAGISGSQISRIENGLRGVPKPATLRKIADATGVSYDQLMAEAGYLREHGASRNENPVPGWATSKDKRDFRIMLEDDGELMFDGIPLNKEDKQRIKDVLTGLFWEAKQMNKRKKSGSASDNTDHSGTNN